jgi:hypothetical protein
MIHTDRQTLAKAFMALGLLWVFYCCTSPNSNHQTTPEELPAEEPMAEPETPVEPAPVLIAQEPRLHVHIVRWPGESLSHIALWYTGDETSWKALVEANSGINPNRIFIGNRILIPEDLLKTREAMPRDFLSPSGRKKKARVSPVQQPPTESDETQLFGPIE